MKHQSSIRSELPPSLTVISGDIGSSGGLTDWQIALAVSLPIVFIVCLLGLIVGVCYLNNQMTKSRPDNNRGQYHAKNPQPYIDIDSTGQETASNSVVIVTEEVISDQDQEEVLTVFDYEGDGESQSGSSLSSILTESDAESIYQSISRLGGKFCILAKIYKEDDENTESDNRIYSGAVPVPSHLELESWV